MSEYDQCVLAIRNEDVSALFNLLRNSINDLTTIKPPNGQENALFWLALRAEDPRIRNIALKTSLGRELLEIFPIINSYNYVE